MRITHRAKTFLVLAAAAAVAGCGQSATSGASAPSTQAAPSSQAAAATTAAPTRPCTVDDIGVSGTPGQKPSITVPDSCAPPTTLLTKDLVAGTGPEVKAGGTVQTHYQLVTWSDRRELDSSWNRGQTFELKNVGSANVIDGWNEGMIGIRQGGRRLLVIPPDKAYGEGGRGIKPNETLVFVVDAVQVAS